MGRDNNAVKKTKSKGVAKLTDYSLRSMLAPKPFTTGIIQSLAGIENTEYEIPEGMTEEQAMLITLGAIMDPELMAKCKTGSSAPDIPEHNWVQVYLFEDFVTGDEKRSTGFDNAVIEGRKRAIAAFTRYASGDKKPVEEMAARASKVIRGVASPINVSSATVTNGILSAVKLLKEAAGEPDLDKAMELNDERLARFDDLEIQKELCNDVTEAENKFKAEFAKALPERRRELLIDYCAKEMLFREATETNSKAESVRYDLDPERFIEEGKYGSFETNSLRKDPEIHNLKDRYAEEYMRTHPDSFTYYMSIPEEADNIKRAYREAVENFEGLEDAVTGSMADALAFFRNVRDKLNPAVPDHMQPEERKQLEDEWKKIVPAYTEKARLATERIDEFQNSAEEEILKKVKDCGINEGQIVDGDVIGAGTGLAAYLREGKPVYVKEKNSDSLVKVSTKDCINFDMEEVKEIETDDKSTSANKRKVYFDECRKGFNKGRHYKQRIYEAANENVEAAQKSLANKEGAGKVEIDEELQNLVVGLHELDNEMENNVGNFNDDVVSIISHRIQQIDLLIEAWKNKNPKNELYCDEIKKMTTAMREGIDKAAEKQEQYMAEHRVFAGNVIDLKNREEVIDAYIADRENARIVGERVKKNADALNSQNEIDSIGRNTDAHAVLKGYLEQLKKAENITPELEKSYTAYIGALENLNRETDDIYAKDIDGAYKHYNVKDYDRLLNAYNETSKTLGAFRSMIAGKGYDALEYINDSVKQILNRDINILTSLNPASGKSIAEAMDSGRVNKVDITGKKLSYLGAVSSRRYAMQLNHNGTVVKGFCTKETKFDLEAIEASVWEDVLQKYPEYRDATLYLQKNKLNGEISGDRLYATKKFYLRNGKTDLVKDSESLEQYTEYLEKGLDAVDLTKNQYKMYIKAEQGTTISGRNVAMTKVANLLGIPGHIARSEFLDVIEDGKVERGVFMENAIGTSRMGMKPYIGKITPESAETPELIKQLAELQVLDYICGNVDRHRDNMFYILNEDKTRIIGVQGIDNDFSFGTADKDKDPIGANDVTLEDMMVVSRAVADKVMAMDPETMRFTLAGTGLGISEIDKAIVRLGQVKENILNGKLQIIEDDKWVEQSIHELADRAKENTLFRVVSKVADTLEKEIIATENMERRKGNDKKEPLVFTELEVWDGLNAEAFADDSRRTAKFAADLERAQKLVWRSSTEFKNIIEANNNLAELLKNFPKEPEDMDYMQVQRAFEVLATSAEKYCDTKKGKKLDSKEQFRKNIAEEIKNYAKTRGTNLTSALHDMQDRRIEKERIALNIMNREAQETKALNDNVIAANDAATDYALAEYSTDKGTKGQEYMMAVLNSMAKVNGLVRGEAKMEELQPQVKGIVTDLVIAQMIMAEREQFNPGYTKNPDFGKELKAGPLEALINVTETEKFRKLISETTTVKELCKDVDEKKLLELVGKNEIFRTAKAVVKEILEGNKSLSKDAAKPVLERKTDELNSKLNV